MIKLFADDTSPYIVVDNSSAFLLNNDLDQINKWSRQWFESFNPAKTECLTISNKANKRFHPSLHVHQKEVESHKHLGVVFSSYCNLTWNLHIEEVVEKAYSCLCILRRVKYNLGELYKKYTFHSSDRF